jgi:hypothetical protein
MYSLVTTPDIHRPAPSHPRANPLLLVGKLSQELLAGILDAVGLAGHAVRHPRGVDEALSMLACKRLHPKGVLIHEDVDDKARFVAWLRERAGLFDVPVVVLVARLSECEYATQEAKQCGADDAVLAWDQRGIARRLLALNGFVPGENPPAERGTALVAHADDQTRRHAGWILRRAGFELAFAQSRAELVGQVQGIRPALAVVASALLDSDPSPRVVAELRDEMGQPDLPLVVVAENPTELAAWQRAPRTAVTTGGSWDHLLFQVNEVTRPPAAELRATPRLYLSTYCAFRRMTELNPTHALTYNVSEGGLFIRTLDPPPAGTVVSIDLRLPRTGTLVVTLRARVVWVQKPVHGSAGPTPLGFGVEILPDESPLTDLELYLATCQMLSSEATEVAQACA